MRTGWLAVCALLSLTGCVGQQEIGRMEAETANAAVESQWCALGLDHNPRYQALAPHMPLGEGISTGAQLTDNSYVDPQMTRVLYAWHHDLNICRQIALNTIESVVPEAVPAVQEGYAKSDATLEQLSRGRITYGEANRARDEVAFTLEQQLIYALQTKRVAMVALDNEALAQLLLSFADPGLFALENWPASGGGGHGRWHGKPLHR